MSKGLSSSWIVALLFLACARAPAPEDTAATGASAGGEVTAPPTTFAEQVALGGELYGQNCAGCHGGSGEGTQGAPAVVGLSAGALPLAPRPGSTRAAQFVTVADVATFVVQTMPPKAPGSLSAEEYWAVLAFDLSANGISLDQKLTPELATSLTIPR